MLLSSSCPIGADGGGSDEATGVGAIAARKHTKSTNESESQSGSPLLNLRPILKLAESMLIKCGVNIPLDEVVDEVEGHLQNPLSRSAREKVILHLHRILCSRRQHKHSIINLDSDASASHTSLKTHHNGDREVDPVEAILPCPGTVGANDGAVELDLQSLKHADLFLSLRSLQDVCLHSTMIDVDLLTAILSQSRAIETLKLIEVAITNTKQNARFSAVANYPGRLKAIHLIRCEVERPAANDLESWLLMTISLTSLTSLLMDHTTGISASCIQQICGECDRQLEMVLRCMPVPPDLLSFPSLSRVHLIDCNGSQEAIAAGKLGPALKELKFWGPLDQKDARCFFRSFPGPPSSLEVLTLTICGPLDLHKLQIHELLKSTSVKTIDIVAMDGLAENSSVSTLVRALQASSIQSFGIRGKATPGNTLAEWAHQILSVNQTIRRLHLLGHEWKVDRRHF